MYKATFQSALLTTYISSNAQQPSPNAAAPAQSACTTSSSRSVTTAPKFPASNNSSPGKMSAKPPKTVTKKAQTSNLRIRSSQIPPLAPPSVPRMQARRERGAELGLSYPGRYNRCSRSKYLSARTTTKRKKKR